MRTIRQLCAATFLTLILTISAFAGDIQTPSITTPPQITGDIQMPGASVAGQIDTPGLTSDADSVAEIALALMVNVLSVF